MNERADRVLSIFEAEELFNAYTQTKLKELESQNHRFMVLDNKLIFLIEFDLDEAIPPLTILRPEESYKKWLDNKKFK